MRRRWLLRVTAPMVGVSLLLLTVGVVAAWYLHLLQKENSDLLLRDVSSMLAAEDLEIQMRDVRNRLKRLVAGDRTALDRFPAMRANAEAILAEAKARGRTPLEHELAGTMKRGCDHVFQIVEQLQQQRLSAANANAIIDELIANEVSGPVRGYVKYHKDVVSKTRQESERWADRMGLGLLLLGICGSVGGLLAGFGIARGISRSIVQLSMPVRGVAGKLNEVVGPITLSTGGGFEDLEVSLRHMAYQIGSVVERLEQREREVLRSERLAAVGQLAAGIAHELRNPLMAMRILVQAAVERNDGGGLRGRDLTVVDEEISRLEQSIQTLLDFARPPKPSKSIVDLRYVVKQTTHLVSARAQRQRVEIREDLPARPVLVEADAAQMRQVLVNLLLNALDSLPDGGSVEITAGPSQRDGASDPNGWSSIRIADNGSGLPPDLGNRIFEPFVSTKETGTGLGLSICQRIVEDHGGEITAENRPQGGAMFTIWLPRAVPDAALLSAPAAPHALSAGLRSGAV